jgi:WD40 repeat protein/serine/threonine protein kinase
MAPDPDRAEEVFVQAVARTDPDGRLRYLNDACGADAALRARVDALLAAHDDAGTFLVSADRTAEARFAETTGTTIGRYKLLEQIGEGGMGVVFMAEQRHPVHRRVALKIIKPGMDTRQVIARFEAERQALALMEHPNIARVLEAGTTDAGRPYFVMELVKGLPITRYCDENKLSTRQRLALFVLVCQAVQHAHLKGIIHRDLKPTNVLVSVTDDEKPVPKVIDFGIAKATAGQSLTDRTLFTEFRQLVGTPLYMSPEQAETSALLDVDTRSDVYALGVVLYELLTGTTPFDKQRLARAASEEVRRIIREEEPPRPSTRISTLGPALTVVSAQRQTDAKKLGPIVRGELDWIVMRALEKDRRRRYETASDLAQDVERYLQDQPVEACPPSKLYRLRKRVRKYRVPLGVGTALVLLLLGLGGFSYYRIARANRLAEQRAREAISAKRETELLLARSLVDQADAIEMTGGARRSRAIYAQAAKALADLGVSTLPADLGLHESYNGHPPPLMELSGHGDAILSAAFCPDGRHALTASEDETLKYWDLRTGTVVHTLSGHKRWVIGCAVSPDGNRALSAGDDGTVRLWDLKAGRELKTLRGHTGPVRVVAFTSDGKRAISGGADKTARLWDLDTGETTRVFEHDDTVAAVAISADDRRVLVGTNLLRGARQAVLWDVDSGRLLHAFQTPNGARSVAILPDGRRAVMGGFFSGVRLVDVESGKFLKMLANTTNSCIALVPSRDGRRLLTGAADGSVCIREIDSDTEVGGMVESNESIRAVAFSPDERLVLAGGIDRVLRVWPATRSAELVVPALPGIKWLQGAKFSDDGLLLYASTHLGFILDAATGMALRRSGPVDRSAAAEFAADAATLITIDKFGVTVADADSFQPLCQFNVPTGIPFWFGGSRSRVIVSTTGGEVTLWDARSGRLLHNLANEGDAVRCVISKDGETAVTQMPSSPLRIWNTSDGSEIARVPVSATVVAMAYAPDDRTVLAGCENGVIHVIGLQPPRETVRLSGHSSAIEGVSMSADGTLLLSSSNDGSIRLWDVATRRTIHAFLGAGRPARVAIAPDGRRMILTRERPGEVGLLDLSIWNLDRVADYRRFEPRVASARAALAAKPDDAGALLTMAQWYDFRGVYAWAADLYAQARAAGADVRSLDLARCYWRLGRLPEARDEFRTAAARNEASAKYLTLCLEAVTSDAGGNQ